MTNLLSFPNYTSYLDSFLTKHDKHYISDIEAQRKIVKLNYKKETKIYTAEEFLEHKKEQLKRYYHPQEKEVFYDSSQTESKDPLLIALALRDKPNQQKFLTTIIFMFTHNSHGMNISGFIDFDDSLNRSKMKLKNSVDWTGVFKEEVALRPTCEDLSYINWYTGKIYYNNTANYYVLHENTGVIFLYRPDQKKLPIGEENLRDERFFSKTVIVSEKYGYVVLYDHIIRKRY